MTSIYDFDVKTISSQVQSMKAYEGKVLLIVNVASRCGYTPQYTGLEALYEKYKDKGLVVMGFPCNQFGAQESGTEEEIKTFCDMNYKITFPMFSKIDVNGSDAHPMYQYLKREKKGILGTEAIKWNFTKFLVSKSGQVIERFAPNDEPKDLEKEILKLI